MADFQLNTRRILKRWIAPDPITPDAEEQLKEYPSAFRQVLFHRGLDTAEKARDFLLGTALENDPFSMKGMSEAVETIMASISANEGIVVYGDYDVDGVTATTLLVQAIRELGGMVSEYIPNRFDEGYGLNVDALRELKEKHADLVITVDCGIRSIKEAGLARELGIKLIISDHHHPLGSIPSADVVICPKQEGDEYPYKELAGVGIAYKIAEALYNTRGWEMERAGDWLDLVALGTVSDIAPLSGENRLLVRKGLRRLQTQPRQGVYSLMGVADIKRPGALTAADIGFKLGPRLNAAGRMESALDALSLLMSTDPAETGLLAQKLQKQNTDRQDHTIQNQQFAEAQLTGIESLPILIAFGSEEEFHSGIVGLVAARLVESHYRPAVVGVIGEEFTRASCRSIDEFHITQALDECADLMVRHGGHSKAAGFTVRNENRDLLKKRLIKIASSQLNPENLIPTIRYDAEVKLSELQAPLIALLQQMEPTGNENPKPLFMTRGLRVSRKNRIGHEKNHLRMTVVEEKGISIDGVAFRMGDWMESMPEKIDIVYHFELNDFNGQVSFQLNIRDIRPSEEIRGDHVDNSSDKA